MAPPTAGIDADVLRVQLMSSEPTRRVMALYALEIEAGRAADAANRRLADDVERFAARGIPFYAPHDDHYRAWVDRAVGYWERLHAGVATA